MWLPSAILSSFVLERGNSQVARAVYCASTRLYLLTLCLPQARGGGLEAAERLAQTADQQRHPGSDDGTLSHLGYKYSSMSQFLQS